MRRFGKWQTRHSFIHLWWCDDQLWDTNDEMPCWQYVKLGPKGMLSCTVQQQSRICNPCCLLFIRCLISKSMRLETPHGFALRALVGKKFGKFSRANRSESTMAAPGGIDKQLSGICFRWEVFAQWCVERDWAAFGSNSHIRKRKGGHTKSVALPQQWLAQWLPAMGRWWGNTVFESHKHVPLHIDRALPLPGQVSSNQICVLPSCSAPQLLQILNVHRTHSKSKKQLKDFAAGKLFAATGVAKPGCRNPNALHITDGLWRNNFGTLMLTTVAKRFVCIKTSSLPTPWANQTLSANIAGMKGQYVKAKSPRPKLAHFNRPGIGGSRSRASQCSAHLSHSHHQVPVLPTWTCAWYDLIIGEKQAV